MNTGCQVGVALPFPKCEPCVKRRQMRQGFLSVEKPYLVR